MSMETVEPPKNAESNGETASAPGVNRRGFGRLAVNSAVMIAILAALLTLQDSHARSVATARLTAETRRAAILSVNVVHPSVGAASTELSIPSNTLLLRREGNAAAQLHIQTGNAALAKHCVGQPRLDTIAHPREKDQEEADAD